MPRFPVALAALIFCAAVLPARAATPSAPALQNQSRAAAAPTQPADDDQSEDNRHLIRPGEVHNPILWRDPGRIADENLLYGQGGKNNQPVPPFQFLEEDRRQSTPKFDVRDAKHRKWRVKLGGEARPEVVASRLLWAVGYFAQDDYNLASAEIPGIHMHRGRKFIHGDQIHDARFYRKPSGQKKIATWRWRQNPFTGTHQLNGLRVMMALLNSWDLKDENNSVYEDKNNDRQIFLVSDTGTAFGRTGLHFTNGPSKDNVRAYIRSRFITRKTGTTVSFATPSPSWSLLAETLGFGMKQFIRRQRMLWIGRNIPIQDAKWIGGLLGQLTHQQLVDAFRAANYPPDQIDQFVTVVESRIKALNDL